MKRRTWGLGLWICAAALAMSLLAACQATPLPELPTALPPTAAATTTPEPTVQPAPVPLTPAAPPPAPSATPPGTAAGPIVASARADLAQKLSIPLEEVGVRSVEAVEWPDGSLGCPQPGVMYIQVVTPGFRILLEAQGRTYEYHTDRGLGRVLCNR